MKILYTQKMHFCRAFNFIQITQPFQGMFMLITMFELTPTRYGL